MPVTRRASKKRDTNLQKLYAQYAVAKPTTSEKKDGSAPTTPAATPVLTAAEAKFVRRDLARVIIAAFITLILIVAVWSTSAAPYWSDFVTWLSQITHL